MGFAVRAKIYCSYLTSKVISIPTYRIRLRLLKQHTKLDTSPSYLENAVDITSSNQRVPQGFQMLACFALYYPTTVESSKRNNPAERRKASAKKLYFLPRYGLSTFQARTTTVRVPTSRPQWAIISYMSNHQLLIRLHALRLSEISITFSYKYLSLSYALLTMH